ncbi:MAG: ECF transporter S component [Eubacterium sp.]|nr:ECF transporter S component [Eubacterium sp.]
MAQKESQSKYIRSADLYKRNPKRSASPKKADKRKERAEKRVHKKAEYRESVITPERAKKAFEAENSTAEELPSGEISAAEETLTDKAEVKERVSIYGRGSTEQLFENRAAGQEQIEFFHIDAAEESAADYRKRAGQRVVFCAIGLAVATVVLSFIRLHLPVIPSFLSVDFSIIPEFLAAVAYGPFVGVLLCLVKNIVNIVVTPNAAVSDVTAVVLEVTFLVVTELLYSRLMRPKEDVPPRDNRGINIFISGTAAAVAAVIPNYFMTAYFSYPTLIKAYSSEFFNESVITQAYLNSAERIQSHLPQLFKDIYAQVTTLNSGILLINLPITLAKLMLAVVITAILYPLLSPVLYYWREEYDA